MARSKGLRSREQVITDMQAAIADYGITLTAGRCKTGAIESLTFSTGLIILKKDIPAFKRHFSTYFPGPNIELLSVDQSIRQACLNRLKREQAMTAAILSVDAINEKYGSYTKFIKTTKTAASYVKSQNALKLKYDQGLLLPWNKGKLGTDSDELYKKLIKPKLGIKNPMHFTNRGVYPEDLKIKQSFKMKAKILSGEFTPHAHNSNTKWDATYKDFKFRSSWEAAFFALNDHLLFETIRISWIDKSLHARIYIVDFEDPHSKILYEVKPKSFLLHDKNECLAKVAAAKRWCHDNGYSFQIISEDYLFDVGRFKLLAAKSNSFSKIAYSNLLKSYEAYQKNKNR